MAKKKNNLEGTTAPVTPISNELPKSLEYVPRASSEKWRIERFDLMAAQFELSAPWGVAAQSFHEFAEAHARTSAWLIAKRLFGIMPLIPMGDLHPDDLRVNSREEVSQALGLSADQVKAEMEFLKAGYAQWNSSPESPAEGLLSHPITPSTELPLDDKVLEQFGFTERMFKIEIVGKAEDGSEKQVPRQEEENRIERTWFIGKLQMPEWQKMLSEPLASGIARDALMNELYLHRLQQEMMMLSPSSSKFQQLSKTQSNIESQYRDQLEQLHQKFPEMAIAGKVNFRGCISDLNLAHRQYYGHKDRRLYDRVHTAAEIVFLIRQSHQLPSARYRMGWTVAVVEAINGIYNPDFRSLLKKSDLKKLDMGFKMGIDLAREELGQRLPNLEKGVAPGDGEGFEDFPTASVPIKDMEQPATA